MSDLMAVLLNGIAQLEYDRQEDLPIFHAAYLRKMDKKMHGGITLGEEAIENPNQDERNQFVAANLYAALKDNNLSLSQACTTYLAEHMPELKQVKFDDTQGEVEINLVLDEPYIKQEPISFKGVDLSN